MEQDKQKIQQLQKRVVELEEKVEFYEMIAEDSADLEIFRSPDGSIKYVNKAFERFLGYKPEDFREGRISEKDFVHPEDYDEVREEIKTVLERKPIVDFEFRMVRKDESVIYTNLNSVPIYKNGEFMGARTSIRDITEHKIYKDLKIATEKIQLSEQKFRKYLMCSPTAIFITDEYSKYTMVNPAACQLLNYTEDELLGLSIIDISGWEGPDKLESFKTLKERGETRNVEVKLRKSNGDFVDVVLDAVKISENEYIAFVKDMTKLRETERMLKKQVEEYAALNEEYISSNEELRLTNRQLAEATQIAEENEKYLQTLIERAPFPIVITDENQDIEFFNNKFIEVFGYTKDDVSTAQQWWLSAYPDPEYRETVRITWMRAINKALENNTEIERQEWEMTAKDGSKRLSEFFMTPLGKRNLIVMNDITEERRNLNELIAAKQRAENSETELQKQIEEYALLNEEYLSTNEELLQTNEELIFAKEQMEESEEKHRFLFENMPQGVVYHSNTGEIIYANDSAARILGLTKDQLFGKTSLDPRWNAIHEDGSEYPGDTHPVMITLKSREPVKNAIMGVSNLEMGGYTWININSVPKFDKDDKAKVDQVVVTFEDITDLKNTQLQLMINEERYRKAQEAGKIGSWEYDIKSNEFWGSDEGKKIYGFETDDDSFSADTVMSCVVEKDSVNQKMLDLIKKGKPYNIKFEIIPRNSDEKKTIHSMGELVRDKNGKPIKVTGVLRDITEQSRQESEILKAKELAEESEKRFKALHNASFGGIAIHDKGLILDCNQGLSDMTGYSLDELVGMDGLLLISDSTRDMVIRNIENKYEKPYEAIGVRKDGTEYPIRLEARQIPYKGKEVRVVEFRDITEFKKAESDIKSALAQAEENEKQFRQLFENMEQGFAVHEMIYDKNGNPDDYKFLLLNKAFGKLTGLNPDDLIGKTVLETMPGTEQIWIDNYGEVARTGKSIHFDNFSQELDRYYDVVAYSPKQNFFAVVITDVTENKNYQQELIESKEKAERNEIMYKNQFNFTKALTDNLPIPLFYKDKDARYIGCNPAFEEFLGVNEEDIIGKTIYDVWKENWAEEYLWRDIELLGNENDFESHDLFIRNADGELRTVLTNKAVFFDDKDEPAGIVGVYVDITERKNTELLLRQNADRLKILYNLNQMQNFKESEIYDYALEKAIELCNSKIGFLGFLNEDESIVSIHAWSDDVMKICQVKDKNIDFVVEKTGIWGEVVRQRKPIIINDYKADNPLKRGTPEGHVDIQNYLSIPVFDRDKIVAVMAVGNKDNDYNEMDMQELTLLTDGVWNIIKRYRSEIELVIAKEKAEESNRLKSAFLQNMSHEIRTPMNAIIGFSEFLGDEGLTEDDRNSYVKIIQNSCHQLLGIVTDILTISAIDTNQEKVNIQKTSVNSIIVELLSIFKKQATNKNISLFAKQLLRENQSEIYTDKTKVTQILSNLISNALKFTYEGFVEFGYNLKEFDGNSYLQFYVKDTGIGIRSEHHQEIFERFRQADDTVRREHGGTGLGLSISRGFVQLLGGDIWVESELGKGSTFYFTVPYNPIVKKDTKDEAEKIDKNLRTIVVAEDEEYNYLFIEISLRDLNVKLIHTRNGKETVDFCRSNKNIDLILMDIKMPIMDGHEAAKQIKSFNPDIPIIAQSAYALEHEIEKYGGIFDDYLTKPLTKEMLQKAIKNLIGENGNME
jgi:PAS domain S-box-containing protein